MFMLPMMLWKYLKCEAGWQTTYLQLLGLCVVTSIWLKWPLTKMAFCLFIGQLGKGKPSTICTINWAFLIPILIVANIVGFGSLGLTFELALTTF